MKFTSVSVLLLMATTFFGSAVTSSSVQAEQGVQSAPWKFRANVYGWLPDAPATINYDGTEVVDVPEDLGTILDDADALAMFDFQATKGRLWLFANTVYYKGTEKDNFTAPMSGAPSKFTLKEEVTFIKSGVGYTLGPWDAGNNNLSTVTLTPWAGVAWFHDNWSVKEKPKDGPGGGKVSGTFEFTTPMVGLNLRSQLAKDWDMLLSYGQGGGEIDDVDKIYDFVGGINYNFKMYEVPTAAFFGYRYFYVDWEDDPEELRLTVKGPFVGIGWEF